MADEKVLEGKIIAVDFDSTIAHYSGFKGVGVYGKPVESVQWALGKFREMGAEIIVHTCRGNVEIPHIAKYLKEHKIPHDYINYSPRISRDRLSDNKVAADFYIDDKGIQFRGEWKETYLQILNFKGWEKEYGKAIGHSTT